MAREVFVTLGGAERRLRLTTREAIELKRRFGKTPKQLLRDAIAPSDNGRPTGDFDPDVVVATLFLALRHTSRKLTEAHVEEWFDQACREPGGAPLVLGPLSDEFMLSGIIGHSIDIEQIREAQQEGAAEAPREEAGGKAIRPPENP